MAKQAKVVDVVEVAECVEQPKYAKIVMAAIAGAEHKGGPVLSAPRQAVCRPGSCRAAAFAALAASVGQSRPAVLAAVAAAERQWHIDNLRTPKSCAPAGWLKLFGAEFE